jgi:tetratricopeptide (TPR) repeat protein
MLEETQQAYLAKNYKEAIKLYTALVIQDPDNPLNHLGLAKALFKSKQYAEAKIHTQKALELDASLAEAYALLAYIQFWMKGDFKIVYSLAEQAYAIDENSVFCIRSFAFASFLVDKQEQSAHLSERLLELDKDEYDVYLPLIGIYISMNRREDAYRMSWRYLKSHPSLTSLYCFYATAVNDRARLYQR